MSSNKEEFTRVNVCEGRAGAGLSQPPGVASPTINNDDAKVPVYGVTVNLPLLSNRYNLYKQSVIWLLTAPNLRGGFLFQKKYYANIKPLSVKR